ncbi:MAG TPA: NAD-dependent epimerase/dehydratase family protein [Thermomonas sp.]|nr:NAD-dependent epimerase/dehydratase family protein [Thermomonas sp.]
MKRALVFGASGQIGMPLLERLNDAGWRVYAVSRQARSDAPGRHWLRGDLAHVPGLPEAVDAIFSCGPLDLFARWHAQTTIRCPRVVAFGSTSATTKHGSDDDDERDVARRLLGAEAALFASSERRGASATVLRPTLVYGAGRDATLTRIARLAQRWGRFVLPRRSDGLRQPVHVDDLAAAALAACTAPATHGRSYDLPGGETLAYREMVRRVLACLQPAPSLLELPMPLFQLALKAAQARGIANDLTLAAIERMRQDLVFDIEPAKRDFGYAARAFKPEARMFESALPARD